MNAVEEILTQYSIESIILLIIVLLVALKFVSELWEWLFNKVKKHFNIQTEKQQQDEKDRQNLILLEDKVNENAEATKKQYNDVMDKLDELLDKQQRTTERLQENTRSYIIDKHHYFCYQIKAIDDMNLQSLERRYMYYKAEGGNSFIDGLMEQIRQLPRVNLQHKIEEIHLEESGF